MRSTAIYIIVNTLAKCPLFERIESTITICSTSISFSFSRSFFFSCFLNREHFKDMMYMYVFPDSEHFRLIFTFLFNLKILDKMLTVFFFFISVMLRVDWSDVRSTLMASHSAVCHLVVCVRACVPARVYVNVWMCRKCVRSHWSPQMKKTCFSWLFIQIPIQINYLSVYVCL